jgi:hypothetical protein
MTATNAIRAASFVSSIGVNTHINYSDGKYVNINNVLSDLKYLGVTEVRDAALNSAWDYTGQAHYANAAAAGIKFDFVVQGGRSIADTLSQLDAFETAHPGSIAAIEGPNEINNQPFSYNGLTGAAAAVAFQDALYAAVRADPLLKNIPVFSFSLGAGATPDAGSYNQVALHPYPQNGTEPLFWLQNEMKYDPAGSQPVVTEFGYSSLASWWMGVDTTTQAKETLNGLFDAMKLGISQTFLYELLDAYADPNNSNGGNHYGLFDYNNNPKPVAVAIHNLTTILADTGAQASTFATGGLGYSVNSLPSSGSTMLLEKSNGTFDLVLWSEPTIWNSTTHKEVSAKATNVTVNLGKVYASVELFDPLSSSSPIRTYKNVSQVTVSLTDHPLIVQLAPPTATQTQKSGAVSAGSMVFNTSSAAQTINLASPNETVHVNPGFGKEVISGYLPGQDTLEISKKVFPNAQNLLNHAVDDGHGDVVISYNSNETLTLLGVTHAQLAAHTGDFLFF